MRPDPAASGDADAIAAAVAEAFGDRVREVADAAVARFVVVGPDVGAVVGLEGPCGISGQFGGGGGSGEGGVGVYRGARCSCRCDCR